MTEATKKQKNLYTHLNDLGKLSVRGGAWQRFEIRKLLASAVIYHRNTTVLSGNLNKPVLAYSVDSKPNIPNIRFFEKNRIFGLFGFTI